MGQTRKTDEQIQTELLDELRWDTRVKKTDIGIEVHAGVVTLTGAVESWSERLAAQEAAHRVSGVLDVANDIVVKVRGAFERNDTDIAQAARHALEWDVLVPDVQVQTTVSNGVVTLEGTVDYWSQFDDAARCVRNLAGVCEVRNLIRVEPSLSKVGPQSVHAAIEQALERHAQHAAKRVNVVVAEGHVVLTGVVPSWAELDAIEGAVRGTRGVRVVDNQLRIQA